MTYQFPTQIISNIRRQSPLIHCITNYVTANDVANMILAIGGAPIMADGILDRKPEPGTDAQSGNV